jgi:DNA-directed RNA polymerase specialized sigma24 family protein
MSAPNESESNAFPETAWSCVRAAVSQSEALGRLLSLYRAPLVEFLRSKGTSTADAEDVVHQFFTERLIEGRTFLGQADAERGRFRTYLCTAVWRFWIDSTRTARSFPSVRMTRPVRQWMLPAR